MRTTISGSPSATLFLTYNLDIVSNGRTKEKQQQYLSGVEYINSIISGLEMLIVMLLF